MNLKTEKYGYLLRDGTFDCKAGEDLMNLLILHMNLSGENPGILCF